MSTTQFGSVRRCIALAQDDAALELALEVRANQHTCTHREVTPATTACSTRRTNLRMDPCADGLLEGGVVLGVHLHTHT